MTNAKLDLIRDFLTGTPMSQENIALLGRANCHFDLGLGKQQIADTSRARQLCGWLSDCD